MSTGRRDDPLLKTRQLRVSHFNAQVAARNHDGITRRHNLVQFGDGFRTFDLGHHKARAARIPQEATSLLHILRSSRKRDSEIIDTEFGGCLDIRAIFICQRAR